MIVLTAGLFSGGSSVSAQTTTDFTLWKDAKQAENVYRMAQLLNRDFRNAAGTDRKELLANTLSALVEIASSSDVVPSARYNAILAIGQLESSPGIPPALPVAYPEALTFLADFYQKADSPHYLKLGALLGIVRHALCGIDPPQRDNVIDLLLETVTSEFAVGFDAPQEPAVWDWFRHTALDGLSALKTPGIDGNVVAELLFIIDRKSQELEELCNHPSLLSREAWEQTRRTIEFASKAAKTLGDLDYQPETDVDATAMSDAFIGLTIAVCDVAGKMTEDFIKLEKKSLDPAVLRERMVISVKICTQSVVWGIRNGFLTSKPSENSFYASLKSNEPAIKRLDALMAEIVELSAFFDEGVKAKRTIAIPNMPKEFKFDLSELRDMLKKCSNALTNISE
jgi:hypothetical protein